MRIGIDIDLGYERMTARLRRDGTVLYDDVAVVAVEPIGDRRSIFDRLCGNKSDLMISGIGSDTSFAGPDATYRTVLSRDEADPQLAASIVNFITLKCWNDIGRSWRRPFDRLDISIVVEGFEHLSAADRKRFIKQVHYHPQINWWVNGEKVKF